MRTIKIADTTLSKPESSFSFKEKIEIARQLEKLNADVIELPEIEIPRTDILLIKTLSSFVKNAVISVAAGVGEQSIEHAAEALCDISRRSIRIELPLSPVGMEYTCHKKPERILQYIVSAVQSAKQKVGNVEFCAGDATRAETDFLKKAVKAAAEAGADTVTLCDDAAEMMPDDFAEFVKSISAEIDIPIGVKCSDKNGLASACSILAVKSGACAVKTGVCCDAAETDSFVSMITSCGNSYDIKTNIKTTEIHRTVKQIKWIIANAKNEQTAVTVSSSEQNGEMLDIKDSKNDVSAAVRKLGYDLSEEDEQRVYDEFLRVAAKKAVGQKELDAIVASTALQVPATYTLKSYVINNGNIITASAHIVLLKDGKEIQGISVGDGPIDAAFLSINQIIGRHFELDDFQIQAVTEGKEAMGSALVRLRSGGKLYSGNGISTDIIGASIRAYISAVNKIVYEEV